MIDEHVARGNGLENHCLVLCLPQESHNRDLYSSRSDKRPEEASGRAGKPVRVLHPASSWMAFESTAQSPLTSNMCAVGEPVTSCAAFDHFSVARELREAILLRTAVPTLT